MISLKHSIINLKFHVLNAVKEESIRKFHLVYLLNSWTFLLQFYPFLHLFSLKKFQCLLIRTEENLLSSVSLPWSRKEQ